MQPSSQLILEHFHHPQRNPLAVATPSPHPHAPGNYIFTLCLYGFAWIFHINGIIQYMVFCDCFAHFLLGCLISLLICNSFQYSLFTSLSGVKLARLHCYYFERWIKNVQKTVRNVFLTPLFPSTKILSRNSPYY